MQLYSACGGVIFALGASCGVTLCVTSDKCGPMGHTETFSEGENITSARCRNITAAPPQYHSGADAPEYNQKPPLGRHL